MREYIKFDALLMGRHIDFPLTEEMASNLGLLWYRVNELLRIADEEHALKPGIVVSSGYRPGPFNVKAGGAPNSAHLSCEAVDLADKDNTLDNWLDGKEDVLKILKLSREHPKSTRGPSPWVHLDIRPRANGYGTFNI